MVARAASKDQVLMEVGKLENKLYFYLCISLTKPSTFDRVMNSS